MKKTLLRSTFLLLLVSVIAKILSFLVRILLARTLSESAMNYYTLASPTMVIMIYLSANGDTWSFEQGHCPKQGYA